MNKKEKKCMEEVKRDCLKLKRQRFLTDYGEGQLDLIKILEEKITKKF